MTPWLFSQRCPAVTTHPRRTKPGGSLLVLPSWWLSMGTLGPFYSRKSCFKKSFFFCLCSFISYSSVTSDSAEWSEHFAPPVLQPSLGTSLSLSRKNSPWAFCHTIRLRSHPQDCSSSVTPAAFNFQGNLASGKKQSHHPGQCLQHPVRLSSRSACQLLGGDALGAPGRHQGQGLGKSRCLMFACLRI